MKDIGGKRWSWVANPKQSDFAKLAKEQLKSGKELMCITSANTYFAWFQEIIPSRLKIAEYPPLEGNVEGAPYRESEYTDFECDIALKASKPIVYKDYVQLESGF